jgi:hypothetical protein
VRRAASLTDRDSVFCLAGESGSGKTTLAAQIASDLTANEIVVFVSTRAGIDDALQLAADEVWKRLLGHDRPIDWESLIRRSRMVGLAARGRWLTVCLDITAGTAEAEQLLRLEWTEWNVRLLFTADEAAGKKIREDAVLASRCGVQTVGERRSRPAAERDDLLFLPLETAKASAPVARSSSMWRHRDHNDLDRCVYVQNAVFEGV